MSDVDLLAIAAHRDDAELTCGGTLAKAARAGHRVGILDLTQGETGTRGSAELRAAEAGARRAGARRARCGSTRDCRDAHLANDEPSRARVVAARARARGRAS